jgi:HSP20 family protein
MFGLTPYNRNQVQKRGGRDLIDFYSIFDDFLDDSLSKRNLRNDTFKIDVKDQEKSYLIEAEMPGIKKDEVKLDYQENRLIIGVQKQEEINEEKDNYIHRERRSSSMQRAIHLNDIDAQNISAKLEDGMLKITVPKLEPKTNKLQIEVK